MPRQFSFRGDRLAYSWGIVLLAAIAFGLLWAFGGDTHALIPLYSVGVFLCFTLSQLGHGQALAQRPGVGLALAARGQRPGRGHDGRGPGHRGVREVRGGRVPRGDPRPGARRDDAVHQPPVRPLGARARGRPGAGGRAAAPRGAGRRPDRRPRPGGRSRRSTSAARSTTTSAPCYISSEPEGAAAVREALRAPGAGRPAGRRGIAVSSAGRAAARLPRRARRGVAAGQGRADHLRRDPRVRRAQLVGADPLQPVVQAAAQGACSAGATRSSSTSRTAARIRDAEPPAVSRPSGSGSARASGS